MFKTLHYYLAVLFLIIWTLIMVPLAILGKFVNPSGNLSHKVGRWWSWAILKISRMRLKITGLEHIDSKRQYIFISNHTSAFDIPAIYWGIENKQGMLAKKQLKYIPLFGWAMWAAGHFFVDRQNHKKAMAIMDQVAAMMAQRRDHSLVIFPEGTRSLDGQLSRFKKGAFVLSLQTGIPIVPIVLNGAYKAKSKHANRLEANQIELIVLPPMDPNEYDLQSRDRFVEDAQALFQQYYDAPPIA